MCFVNTLFAKALLTMSFGRYLRFQFRRRYLDNLKKLSHGIADLESIAIAFSGGADSSFLAAVAKQISGIDVVAVTIVSPFLSKTEIDQAASMAEQLDLPHLVVPADLLAIPEIAQNSRDRCYFCKQKIFSLIKSSLKDSGVAHVVHGANSDDLDDFRPGFKAASEMGILAPLVDAGFRKEEIRRCSKEMGLPTWDLPSQSCLATRIPHDHRITAEKLTMVEKSEKILKDLGFKRVRVRCHEGMARLELDHGALETLGQENVRNLVVKELKQIGFLHIALDLEGYVSGKMNR